MEKTADEMFKELGFRKEMVEDTITGEEVEFVHEYRRFDGNYDETISFNDSTKLMFHENLLFNKPSINIFEPRLIQAIYKKCEELRMDIEEAIKELESLSPSERAIETILKELEKKDKIINKISEEVKENLAFERRLKRDKTEPDLYNQGRFYVSDNINNILKGK